MTTFFNNSLNSLNEDHLDPYAATLTSFAQKFRPL